MSNFIKVCPVRAELLLADEQTDGQTDKKNLTIAFRNIASKRKNIINYKCFDV